MVVGSIFQIEGTVINAYQCGLRFLKAAVTYEKKAKLANISITTYFNKYI